MRTFTRGQHTAVVDVDLGIGALALPPASTDVLDPFPSTSLSMHEADFNALGRDLHALGVELDEDDDGGMLEMGETPSGRLIVGLTVIDPVRSEVGLDDLIEGHSRLMDALD